MTEPLPESLREALEKVIPAAYHLSTGECYTLSSRPNPTWAQCTPLYTPESLLPVFGELMERLEAAEKERDRLRGVVGDLSYRLHGPLGG